MSTKTTYLGMNKPDINDTPGTTIPQLASNFDVIDSKFAEMMTSVMTFGAKGDNTTDDTQAFNNAIASLPNGGTVIVPYGKTFKIQGVGVNDTPDYPTGGVILKSNITLLMLGATLQIIPNNSRVYTCLNITNCDRVKVIGGTLIGERSQHTNSSDYVNNLDQWGHGIAVVGSSNIYIEDVKARDFMGDGICVGANSTGTTSSNVNITHCISDNVRRNGLSVTSCYGGTVSNNTFQNTNGCSPESGIDLEPNPGRVVTDMVIENNRCLTNNQHGILLASIQAGVQSAFNCIISKNDCMFNKGSGIYTNTAHRNRIVNNNCGQNVINGLAVTYSQHNIIQGNYADSNGANGIMVGNSDYNNICDNYAYDNGQTTDITYDNIQFFTSNYNNVQNNKARSDSSTKRSRYGIYVTADCNYNIVTNNDLMNSGYYYGLNNASTTTVKGAGNRGNAQGSWGTGDYI